MSSCSRQGFRRSSPMTVLARILQHSPYARTMGEHIEAFLRGALRELPSSPATTPGRSLGRFPLDAPRLTTAPAEASSNELRGTVASSNIENADAEHPPRGSALIRLLGRYSVEGAGGVVLAEGRTEGWSLLGLLAEFRNLPLPRLTAYSRLWPDSDPTEDRDTFWRPMREARGHLLKALGGGPAGSQVIQKIGRSSYRLNSGFCQTDVWQLRDKLTAARAATPPNKAALLQRAVDLYTGPYLPGSEHEYAVTARRALDREVVEALVQLASMSPPATAPAFLERATRIAPTSEHLYRSRIQAYAALGHTTAIHHCFQELSERLKPLRLRPTAPTTDLYWQATRSR